MRPGKIMLSLAWRGAFNFLDDEKYLKLMYRSVFKRKLNLENPKTFNEKLQWLKLNEHNEKYKIMVDKCEAKDYVGKILGYDCIVPTIGVWDRFEDIDFDELPDKFVLKCTHDSDGLVICKNKQTFNIRGAKKKIEKSLKKDYYKLSREWAYKGVKPRIIAEEYLETEDGLVDYKLMCFNGKVKCSFTCSKRFSAEGLRVTFYDEEWNKMPFERMYPSEEIGVKKPKSYDDMVKMAEILSADMKFVRIDFYEVKGKPYFGEITFYPGSGYEPFSPEEWDETIGSWINL